ESCDVKRVMSTAATSGRNRMNQGSAFISMGRLFPRISQALSKFHRGEILYMRGLTLAVEGDNECQADRDLGGSNGNNEKDKHLAVQVIVKSGKRHQRQIGCIKHQFESHVHDQQIAPDDYAHQ